MNAITTRGGKFTGCRRQARLKVDDIVAAIWETALERAAEAPPTGLFTWLRQIVREVSLAYPVTVGGDEERGLILRLIDILADSHASI